MYVQIGWWADRGLQINSEVSSSGTKSCAVFVALGPKYSLK